jgi:hypothetical protein
MIKLQWTPEEDEMIIHLHHIYGNQWYERIIILLTERLGQKLPKCCQEEQQTQ